MTARPADPVQAEYAAAWRGLPRPDRGELTQAALRGQRAVNPWDAAITLWWTQRELQTGLKSALVVAVSVVLVLIGYMWVTTGDPPTTLRALFTASPVLPVFLVIPFLTQSVRRPRLRRAAQLNAQLLAGKTFSGPPDPEEAQRLLNRARKEGWFRGTRPTPDPKLRLACVCACKSEFLRGAVARASTDLQRIHARGPDFEPRCRDGPFRRSHSAPRASIRRGNPRAAAKRKPR